MRWLVLGAGLMVVGGCNSGSAASGSSGSAVTTGGSGSSGATTGAGTSTGGTSSGSGAGGVSSTSGAMACDPACGANASCDAGVCRCVAGMSNCPFRDGGLNCVDENTDNANCSACSNSCPAESTCRGGVCDCDAGPACLTNDEGLQCFDFRSDPDACGSCGNVCSVAGQSCVDGNCECPSEYIVCSGACLQDMSSPINCGGCGNDCGTSYAKLSGCRAGLCSCLPQRLCALLPSGSPPTCQCEENCSSPSFSGDVYPLLAEQTGAFGCAASGCHSGANPAGALGFVDEAGNMDAGMAYAELVGIDGGDGAAGVPACDAGVPAGAPSTQCACVSRVVPGDVVDSYLADVLSNDLPANCVMNLAMPIGADGGWVALNACSQQLIKQWIELGAAP